MNQSIKREVWKDIQGYEGFYQVSNLGRIKSLSRPISNGKWIRISKEKIRKLQRHKQGYMMVGLEKNGKKKLCTVHRLVAEAFIPNPECLPEVNHKDENQSNNHVGNLEWCTRKYNVNYGTGTERRALTRSKPVMQIGKCHSVVSRFSSISAAGRMTGYNPRRICACCRGLIHSAYGYLWKYY